MQIQINKVLQLLCCGLLGLGFASCRKMVEIGEPISTMTSTEVFSTDAQANSAIAGIYTRMINGSNGVSNTPYESFSNGLTTLLCGMSSDDFSYYSTTDVTYYNFNRNRLLLADGPSARLWSSAYTAIYGANAVMEGVAKSSSELLHSNVRNYINGEARFVRAFSYFYLVNCFGDVPLALTIDFNQTTNLPRSAVADVYRQIIADLKEAKELLPDDYSFAGGERVRPNKWAAAALLARAYLFAGDNEKAATEASLVIGNTGSYQLANNLNEAFLANSQEAIWQLQQNTGVSNVGNATPEAIELLPKPLRTGLAKFRLSAQLLSAFEPGDKRRVDWVDSSNNTPWGAPGFVYFPYKYKTGRHNYSIGGMATEYYTVLRLSEQYLIRAEAEANGATGGLSAAISDLNVVRARAGLAALAGSLTADQVKAAVSKERQVELFGEWGHRWFDLKRTGKASEVLSLVPVKQPWTGDFQLLYPIPVTEIVANHNLVQNPGY